MTLMGQHGDFEQHRRSHLLQLKEDHLARTCLGRTNRVDAKWKPVFLIIHQCVTLVVGLLIALTAFYSLWTIDHATLGRRETRGRASFAHVIEMLYLM